MLTSDNIEDDGVCLTVGRNTKKIRFKEKWVDSVEMSVDLVPTSTVSWKDMLLGNSVESSKESGEDGGENFDFVEGYFTRSTINGIPLKPGSELAI